MGEIRKFTFPARYDRVAEICGVVAANAEEAGFDADDVFRIELACDEACTNIVQHSYGGEDVGDIRVELERTKDSFIIILRDQGRQFDPDEIPIPNLPADPDKFNELKIGGLGLHFMRTIMDEIRYAVNGQGDNELVMIKQIANTDSK
jgi:serine/threonine-protein kinase RsbW